MPSVFGGLLVRQADGAWRWSDGTTDSRIRDMRMSVHYNFRCRPGYVEVPIAVARREEDLRWVWNGYTAGRYAEGLSGDHTGPKVLHFAERYEDGDVPGISEPAVSVSASPTRADGSKRAIPRVALVPFAEWDKRNDEFPVGAEWSKADEEAILGKAASLGWRAS